MNTYQNYSIQVSDAPCLNVLQLVQVKYRARKRLLMVVMF